MKLNTSMRQAVVNAVSEKAYKKEFEQWEVKCRALAVEGYNFITPQAVQKMCKELSPMGLVWSHTNVTPVFLPKSALREDKVQIGKTFERFGGRSYVDNISLHDPIFVRSSSFEVVSDALHKKAIKLMKDREALVEKHKEVVDSIRHLVFTAKTVANLEAQWPEGKELLSEFKDLLEKTTPNMLPSVILPSKMIREALA